MSGSSVLFIVLIIFGAVLYWNRQKNQTIKQNWKLLADELELNYTSDGWFGNHEITGKYEGRPVRMWTFSRGGKNKTNYTGYELQFVDDLPEGLSLTPEGFLSKAGQLISVTEDIEIGDEGFDPEVTVQAEDKRAVEAFLTPRRAEAVRSFLDNNSSGKIEQESIYTEHRRFETDPDEIKNILNQLTRKADILEQTPAETGQSSSEAEHSSPSEKSFRQGARAQSDGDMKTAAKQYLAVVDDNPDDLEARKQAGKALYQTGQYEQAQTQFQEIIRRNPGDDEAVKWLDLTEDKLANAQPNSPAEPPEKAPPEPTTEMPPETDGASDQDQSASDQSSPEQVTTPEHVLNKLYRSDQSSADATTYFEDGLKGTEAEWSGTVDSIDELTFDTVYPDQANGHKVEITVYRGSIGSTYEQDYSVTVLIPEKQLSNVEETDNIQFAGRFFKFDHLMKNLYLNDGSIID